MEKIVKSGLEILTFRQLVSYCDFPVSRRSNQWYIVTSCYRKQLFIVLVKIKHTLIHYTQFQAKQLIRLKF